MSKDDRFPHLSLNDDDDEIVIQAGATSRATARESVQSSASQADRDELSRHEEQKHRRADEFSMQTTEDDLHASGPFTRMRAIILIVGVLALAAWIIWWMLR